ncbi:16S rRNA (guanine(966)-N(2))-methyltransferase RsmD [Carnobacteriaceae bacterium zg-ZUI252]|nr:16S rRNA (guanine(966)-N(2))-methyltransferase RsmD [Carnobacteriaceae bacterium zg-ZUI252]
MRVISGEFGGRPLKSLPGNTTRPTSDKVKESIFNIIGPYFDGGVCLDLYAGSGGLSIEAISRGMDKAILFEKDRKAQIIIEQNIQMTKATDQFLLIKGDSHRLLYKVQEKVDLVFLDPPYAKQMIVQDIEQLVSSQLVGRDTLIVCETDKSVELPNIISKFKLWKKNQYGMSAVWFYEFNDNE